MTSFVFLIISILHPSSTYSAQYDEIYIKKNFSSQQRHMSLPLIQQNKDLNLQELLLCEKKPLHSQLHRKHLSLALMNLKTPNTYPNLPSMFQYIQGKMTFFDFFKKVKDLEQNPSVKFLHIKDVTFSFGSHIYRYKKFGEWLGVYSSKINVDRTLKDMGSIFAKLVSRIPSLKTVSIQEMGFDHDKSHLWTKNLVKSFEKFLRYNNKTLTIIFNGEHIGPSQNDQSPNGSEGLPTTISDLTSLQARRVRLLKALFED